MRLVLAALVTAFAAASAAADCMCSYQGGKVEEGDTACIATAEGPELARCGKFLNNTSWIRLGKPCPDKLSKQQSAETQGRS